MRKYWPTILILVMSLGLAGCGNPAEQSVQSDISQPALSDKTGISKEDSMKSDLKENAVVLFAGDSITDGGRNLDDNKSLGSNHPKLFSDYMNQHFPDEKITIYNTGIRGDRLLDFYFRLDTDCMDLKPDYIVLYIGVNDAWTYQGKEVFEKTYQVLLNAITSKTDAKIILVEPFLLPANDEMKKICPIANIDTFYPNVTEMIASVRKIAAQQKLPLIYFSEIMEQAHKAGADYQVLSWDAIHPTTVGAELLIDQILQKLEINGYQPTHTYDFSAIEHQ